MKKASPLPLLSGERIQLRKHELSLAGQMFAYVDKDRERLDRFLPWVEFTKTVKDEEDYIKMTHEKWDKGQLFDYGLFLTESNTYMGNIGVHTICWENQRAEIGYWILGEYEGFGYVSEAVSLLDRHLFEIGFHRVQIRCSSLNERSANIPLRCGYTYEGTARHDAIEKSDFRDTKTFSKLVSD